MEISQAWKRGKGLVPGSGSLYVLSSLLVDRPRSFARGPGSLTPRFFKGKVAFSVGSGRGFAPNAISLIGITFLVLDRPRFCTGQIGIVGRVENCDPCPGFFLAPGLASGVKGKPAIPRRAEQKMMELDKGITQAIATAIATRNQGFPRCYLQFDGGQWDKKFYGVTRHAVATRRSAAVFVDRGDGQIQDMAARLGCRIVPCKK